MSYQLVLRDRQDVTVRCELTGDESRSYAEVRELMLDLERLFPIVHDLRTRYLAVEPVRGAR